MCITVEVVSLIYGFAGLQVHFQYVADPIRHIPGKILYTIKLRVSNCEFFFGMQINNILYPGSWHGAINAIIKNHNPS